MANSQITPQQPARTATGQVAQPVAPDITAEPGGGILDWVLTGAVVAAAIYYLYLKLWRQGGRCDGCGQAKGGSCASSRGSSTSIPVKGPLSPQNLKGSASGSRALHPPR